MTTGRGAFPVTPLLQATTSIFSSFDCNLTKAVFTCRRANISKPASKKEIIFQVKCEEKKTWHVNTMCKESEGHIFFVQVARQEGHYFKKPDVTLGHAVPASIN
jgi:hypothetical protein